MTITEPDPRWAELGRAACAELAGEFQQIEHVGSTSVPGLAAKPVIDLMGSVASLGDVDPARLPGYRLVPDAMPERLFLQRFDPGITYHLHVVTADTWAARNERLLRDHLRANTADRDRYAALKRELMDLYGPGEAYTRGKTDLIQEMTDKARAAHGLPSVPVWEE